MSLKKYIIYDQTRVKSAVTVEQGLYYQVEANMGPGDQVQEVPLNDDVEKYKVKDGSLVQVDLADKVERAMQYFVSELRFTGKESNQEVDQKINDYFLGQIDVATWKKQNYAHLRKFFYPPIEDYVDAHVKLHSIDEQSKQQGSEELGQYLTKCQAVKQRFIKE